MRMQGFILTLLDFSLHDIDKRETPSGAQQRWSVWNSHTLLSSSHLVPPCVLGSLLRSERCPRLFFFFNFWWKIYAGCVWFSVSYLFCKVVESNNGWLFSRSMEEKLREGEYREVMSNIPAKPTNRIIGWHHQSHHIIETPCLNCSKVAVSW